MRVRTITTIMAVTMCLVSCDDDFSYEWADKIHAVSPSGSYVAYVQEGNGLSAVNISFHQNGCCAVAIQFHGTGLPLKLEWLDPTTLEIRYPKDLTPTCDEDARDRLIDCSGSAIRAVPVEI